MVDEFYDIKIKPVAEGWQMGEIWETKLHRDTTMKGLMLHIEEHWGIPWNRQYFRLQNGKGLPLAREGWSFRRLGVGSGYTIQVEPTMYRSWWWHPLKFYEMKLVEQIKQAIKASKEGRLTVEELKDKVDHPPPIATSLKVFIRKYPEYLLCIHDLTQDKFWIQLPSYRYQLPLHTSFPAQLGYASTIKTPMDEGETKYDFEATKLIDTDLKRVEVDFDVPDVSYEITIMDCQSLMLLAEKSHANYAFVCVYFMNNLIGKTYVIRNTRNPMWRDQTFSFAISASVEVFSCSLRFEVWDSDGKIMDDGNFPNSQFLGAAELSGQALIDLICNRKQTIQDLPLEFRAKSLSVNEILKFQYETKQPTVNYSLISGTLKVKGGKKGMEVNVQLGYNLVELPDPRSKPISVVVWNGEDLGQSFPDRLESLNPIFEEVFRIPRLGMNQTLVTSHLEVQIWGTDPENEEIRGDFMGSIQIKEQKLVELMTGNAPFASRFKRELQQSKNIAFKHRKKPVRGAVSIQLGPSGLFFRKAQAIEFEVLAAMKIAKFSFVYYTVDWNNKRIFTSGPCAVVSTKIGEKQSSQTATINQKLQVELDYGESDAKNCQLLILLHEYNKLAGNQAEFLGQISLTGDALADLLSKPFRQSGQFDLENHPFIDTKRQRMIRGQMALRGGRLGLRAKNERTLIVDSCFDLVDLMAKKDIPVLTCPVVVVFWGGKEIGKTRYMMNHTFINSPVWEREIFFVDLPVYVAPELDFAGGASGGGVGGGGGFFGNLFGKMLKKKPAAAAAVAAPPTLAAAPKGETKNADGAKDSKAEKKDGGEEDEAAAEEEEEADVADSLVEGGSLAGSAQGGSTTKSLDGAAKSDDKSGIAGDKDGEKKDRIDAVEYTLNGCTLDIEVWDYLYIAETKEFTQNLFLGGFRVNNESLQELLGSEEPVSKTFELQTNNFKYPGKGKVNPQARCTLSSCGLKYATPYVYWDELQQAHLDEAVARAEEKRLALEREAEIIRVQKEIAWKLLHPDPTPRPDGDNASAASGGGGGGGGGEGGEGVATEGPDGTVLDENGQPIEGGSVDIEQQSPGDVASIISKKSEDNVEVGAKVGGGGDDEDDDDGNDDAEES